MYLVNCTDEGGWCWRLTVLFVDLLCCLFINVYTLTHVQLRSVLLLFNVVPVNGYLKWLLDSTLGTSTYKCTSLIVYLLFEWIVFVK